VAKVVGSRCRLPSLVSTPRLGRFSISRAAIPHSKLTQARKARRVGAPGPGDRERE